ncbi:PRC-barrel domain-containing protein [Dietzia cinnamea]|uniref:PRC-barrel domain-containing protein n=1 Tax=Dietzia cinnamea TaxID=321318 RepID=A0ABV3YM12_9ACTN
MTDNSFDRLANATVYDNSGDKIGKLGTLYVDNDSGQPSFATVSTGLFGMSEKLRTASGRATGRRRRTGGVHQRPGQGRSPYRCRWRSFSR